MNVRIPPKFYVAGEGRIWFVEGFTSDDPKDWKLTTAFRAFDGTVLMNDAQQVDDLQPQDWTLTPWGQRPADRVLQTFTMMVGNIQRRLATLPPIKVLSK